MAYGHGKVILFGEHSVVHGRPALALAVERGCRGARGAQGQRPDLLAIAPWGVEVDSGRRAQRGPRALAEGAQGRAGVL